MKKIFMILFSRFLAICWVLVFWAIIPLIYLNDRKSLYDSYKKFKDDVIETWKIGLW